MQLRSRISLRDLIEPYKPLASLDSATDGHLRKVPQYKLKTGGEKVYQCVTT